MSPATAARRRLIRKLISKGDITSQARLVELLAGEGFSVTQATVSRDLDALGAVKVENSNGVESYTTAVDRPVLSEAEARLRRSVSDFVDETLSSCALHLEPRTWWRARSIPPT